MRWEEAIGLAVRDLPLAFVDVETTGLWAGRGDRICEVAVVVYQGGREVRRFSSLVNPRRPISPGAAAVNRLSDAQVRDAPVFAAIAAEVANALAAGVPVAHNAPFDLSFLAHELQLAGLPPAAAGAIDTLALARRLLPCPRYGLGELARYLALRVPGQAHRALADALTTRELLQRLLERPPLSHGARLADLLALQGGPARWPSDDGGVLALPPELAEWVRPGRRLRIVYVNADGQQTDRLVEPNEVYASGNAVYLVAYCHLRQEQRTFRVDRIVSWEPA